MGKGKKSVEQTYKYSYKVGDNLLSSLSVYNVGYQQCGPEQQWDRESGIIIVSTILFRERDLCGR